MATYTAKAISKYSFTFGRLTTDHPAASYGRAVFLPDESQTAAGNVYGPGDVLPGHEGLTVGQCELGFSLDADGNWTDEETRLAAVDLAIKSGFLAAASNHRAAS